MTTWISIRSDSDRIEINFTFTWGAFFRFLLLETCVLRPEAEAVRHGSEEALCLAAASEEDNANSRQVESGRPWREENNMGRRRLGAIPERREAEETQRKLGPKRL